MVALDVSGSMGSVVRAIHKDLPQLLNLLLGRKYVPHPQIMFSAFSNGTCDAVPLQVGQFESDNRMDENLETMILGGHLAGGCDAEHESSELPIYLAARHTASDAWDKRHRKGYLFMITDEMAYSTVKSKEISGIIGDKLTSDIPLESIVKEARERYHIFVVIPMTTQSGKDPQVAQFWRSHLDAQHVIMLQSPDNISETIALSIGLTERTITLDEGIEHLRADKADRQTINELSSALKIIDTTPLQGSGGGLSGNTQGDTKRTKRL